MDFTFESFVNNSFDYDKTTKKHKCLWLREENMDVGGGIISIEDIDRLKDYPNEEVVTISGLRQDTFEYFIKTYGKQLKAIRFFKNKFVEDLSLLGTLPQLEYVYFFCNQRVTSLWNMTNNTSLSALCIEDFSRITSIKGIETAPNLKEFEIGNAVWNKMVIDTLMPLTKTKIERFTFSGKAIADNDLSFLENMPSLKEFDFAPNMFTTEKVAWISSNFPWVEGYALRAKIDWYDDSNEYPENAVTRIIGKRKPFIEIKGNEEKIQKYVNNFEKLKEKYKGIQYSLAFKS